MKASSHVILTLFFLFSISKVVNAQKLAITPYATGFVTPIDIKTCGDDRIFVANRTGLIQVVNPDGTVRPTPFLNISSKLDTTTDEEGILGYAFSPNYKTDGKFFVLYSGDVSGQLAMIAEQYKVSAADSNVADVSSAITLLTRTEYTSFDLGGNMMFGKDGYLYINLGDGGDTTKSQLKTYYNGKILRVDISNSSLAQPYTIPTTNPFYNDTTTDIKKEIWAYGLRNPWRNSFDRITNDLWLSDVGQNRYEEVNFQPAGDAGGHNYGWARVEGDSCFNPASGCDKTGISFPVYIYPHPTGFVIIGGYVYRSAQSKALFGTYIFSDFATQFVDGLRATNGIITDTIHLLTSAQQTIGNLQSFGEDRYGDQYAVFNSNTTLYKITDSSSTRKPKAYITPVSQNGGISYLLNGLQGRNFTYQWLRNNVIIPGATSPDYTVSGAGSFTLVVTNTLGFSDTSDAFTFGTLPVSLVSFTAQKVASSKVNLEWKISLEQNIAGYTIQRKKDNESDFVNIGFIQSKSINGNSAGEVDYTFDDLAASSNSKLYYRLQIQNKSGALSYSDIRLINAANGTVKYSFYPNPAKDRVQIFIDGYYKPVVMIMYDNNGQKIKEQLLSQANTNVVVSGLKGIYIVQLGDQDGKNSIRKKLVVK